MTELSNEIFQWEPHEAGKVLVDETIHSNYEAYTGPVVEPILDVYIVPVPPPSVPEIGTLRVSIIASSYILFFTTHKTPGSTSR